MEYTETGTTNDSDNQAQRESDATRLEQLACIGMLDNGMSAEEQREAVRLGDFADGIY